MTNLEDIFQNAPIAFRRDFDFKDLDAAIEEHAMAAWMEANKREVQKALEPFVSPAYFQVMERLVPAFKEQLVKQFPDGAIDTTGWRAIVEQAQPLFHGVNLGDAVKCSSPDTQVQKAGLFPFSFVQEECPSCCMECKLCKDQCYDDMAFDVMEKFGALSLAAIKCIASTSGLATAWCAFGYMGGVGFSVAWESWQFSRCKNRCNNRQDCVMCGDN